MGLKLHGINSASSWNSLYPRNITWIFLRFLIKYGSYWQEGKYLKVEKNDWQCKIIHYITVNMHTETLNTLELSPVTDLTHFEGKTAVQYSE